MDSSCQAWLGVRVPTQNNGNPERIKSDYCIDELVDEPVDVVVDVTVYEN